jgi:hypothetical protein
VVHVGNLTEINQNVILDFLRAWGNIDVNEDGEFFWSSIDVLGSKNIAS